MEFSASGVVIGAGRACDAAASHVTACQTAFQTAIEGATGLDTVSEELDLFSLHSASTGMSETSSTSVKSATLEFEKGAGGKPVVVPTVGVDVTLASMAAATETTFARRDHRINSRFLYKHALNRGVLHELVEEAPWVDGFENLLFGEPGTDVDAFLSDLAPSVRRILRVGMLARAKLFEGVVLEPRRDSLRVRGRYTKEREVHSMVRTGRSYLPWTRLGNEKPAMEPRGRMGSIQYTVRGWVSERWRGIASASNSGVSPRSPKPTLS